MTELVIGPFSDFFFGKKNRRIVFKTLPGAPEDYVSLDPKRLLALYEKDGKFYALYSTEKEDYYNQFLSSVPEGAEEKKKLVFTHYKCPLGHIVSQEEAEEEVFADGVAYCPECGSELETVVELEWERSDHDLSKAKQGEAPVFKIVNLAGFRKAFGEDVEEWYSSIAGHCYPVLVKVKETREVEWKGNKIKVERGIGYISESHYDPIGPPAYGIGEYEIYEANGKKAYRLVREIPLSEIDLDAFSGIPDYAKHSLIYEVEKKYGKEEAKRFAEGVKAPLSILAEHFPEYSDAFIKECTEKIKKEGKLWWLPSDEVLKHASSEVKREYEKAVKEIAVKKKETEEAQEIERDEQELSKFSPKIKKVGDALVLEKGRYLKEEEFREFVEKAKKLGYRFNKGRWEKKDLGLSR
ncbi:hypothetical protein B9Q02_10240 [Candidatus Marsarchaeota G1 archaeon BE_D]|jgi:hypothetical protein|uniref:Uncharacterized protein n=1 Tax=Candidatus Marsarchaeota G1 archaeon BE_D TaxID=1978156 RepID=A0A2R6ABN3_9ARCH|nr:MAG: hypothetical protein B9Q02_10240 [Candidatus Marsarchaeota G1 archaeon BE_D]